MTRFIEFENFGWNAITISFLFATFFGLYGARGLVKQIRRVQEHGVGSVSIIWSMTFAFMFVTYLPFGLETHKCTLVLQFFFRVPFYLYLLPLLYKAKGGFNKKEWLFLVGLSAVLLCSFINTGTVFLVLSWAGAAVAVDQPWMLWKNRKNPKYTAAVSTELLWAYEASIVVWLIYGIVVSDCYIIAMSIPYIFVYTTSIVLYYKYH